MKKRLFITSALMTAVMAASLATGTYAWYQAASTGGVKTTTEKAAIATAKPTISVSSELAITVTLTPKDKDVLHMSQLNTEKTGYDSYYLSAQGAKVLYSRPTGAVAVKAYLVEVTIPGANEQEILQNKASLAGVSLKITVAPDTEAGADARTKVWAVDYSDGAYDDDKLQGSEDSTVVFTFNETYTAIDTKQKVAVVYVYVDGSANGKDLIADSDPIKADFKVTVENNIIKH